MVRVIVDGPIEKMWHMPVGLRPGESFIPTKTYIWVDDPFVSARKIFAGKVTQLTESELSTLRDAGYSVREVVE